MNIAAGTQMPNAPLSSIICRLCAPLSTTMAMRGGLNSTGIDQAAAITLRLAPSWLRLVINTVGP